MRRFAVVAAAFGAGICLAGSDGLSSEGAFGFGGCSAVWNDCSLTVSNASFSRVYVPVGETLRTRSFRVGDSEFIDAERVPESTGGLKARARRGKASPAGTEGVELVVATAGRTRRLWIFPGVAGVLLDDPAVNRRLAEWKMPDKDDREYLVGNGGAWYVDEARKGADALMLDRVHLKVVEYRLVDATDVHDELVRKTDWLLMDREAGRTVDALACSLEDTLTGEGVVAIRFAPSVRARRTEMPDFAFSPRTYDMKATYHHDRWFVSVASGYPVAEVVYAGGTLGRRRAFTSILRALRNYRPGRDGTLLTNTWGDDNHDRRINAGFMMREIAAGAELGVDVIQIDDGWQKGKSKNSDRLVKGEKGVWGDFRSAMSDFWVPAPDRFPDGLGPVVKAAAAHGIGFGLWFGPDSSDGYADWKADAETLLGFYRDYGIRYFKIDSLKFGSDSDLVNQRAFFDYMLVKTDSEMTFDLDVTGVARRPGYLGLAGIGPIFVENRFWTRGGYWPHQTLKNLWSLSEVLDPVQLRMEFLNHRKGQGYPVSPLVPSKWRADTVFATVMVSSPLGWFELSGLEPETVAELKPLIAVWKRERSNMHGGVTVPVGAKPDGVSWTGFFTAGADGKNAYALFFRELNASSRYAFGLEGYFPGALRAEVLGGRGTARLEDGRLEVDVPEKLDFIWIKLGS